MRVSKYIHACLVVEEGGDRLLFDPGVFSFIEKRVHPADFEGISAVVITHGHPDHLDLEALKRIVAGNRPMIVAGREVAAKLREAGIEGEILHLEEGHLRVGSFDLEAIPAAHEPILSPTLPQNTAYVVNGRFLHPGDSYAASLHARRGIALLALPITAPWTTELGTAAFGSKMAPKHVLPIHDGYGKEFFLKSRHEALGKHFREQGIEYTPADEPGTAVEI